MSVVVVLAHPTPGSFNHAIAERIEQTLASAGVACSLHSLYAEAFDPILPSGEAEAAEEALPPFLRQHIEEIRAACGIVFVHPNWWGSPPAIMRGWVDRVFRHDFAYHFTEHGPVPHFTDKAVQVFTTANTPRDVETGVYGDPLETHWKKVVFGLCGCASFERRNFASIVMSRPEDRTAWLDEVAATITRRFVAP